jgi:hypothetical protein
MKETIFPTIDPLLRNETNNEQMPIPKTSKNSCGKTVRKNGPTSAAANFLNKEGAIIPAWKTIIPTITPERKIGRTVNIVKSIRLPHLEFGAVVNFGGYGVSSHR